MEKRKYKKRNLWGPRAERLLLELWAERVGDLRSTKKNAHIYKEMASVLQKNEVNVSAEEIKNKLQNMSTKYRSEKASTGVSGGSPSNWEHYNAVHQILGKFKINNETLFEDSLLCEELSEFGSLSMPSSPTSTSIFHVPGSLSAVLSLKEKKRLKWSSAAEEVLIEIWAKRYEDLRDTRRNSHVLEQITDEMNTKGYPFSFYEIKSKLHNFSNKYRAERKNLILKDTPSEWTAFEKVHDILGKYKIYDFEKSDDKTEQNSTNFAFVESDSLMDDEVLSEEDVQPEEEKKFENISIKQTDILALNGELLNKKRSFPPDEDTGTQTDYSKNIKRIKNDNHDTISMEDVDNHRATVKQSNNGSCLDKLANTVNHVVNFMMKSETEKSRNDAFLKVLDSYLLQLPTRMQDVLKIQMLNMVFNKINNHDESVDDDDET